MQLDMRRQFPMLWAALGVFWSSIVVAAPVKLARHPDYHEGKLVFSYQGDLWLLPEGSEQPRRLTIHRARDLHPRFSPDGKWVAFSSSRYGNPDVFVMPSAGGEAKQLTFHSAPDTVVGWSRDGRRILFSSARGRVYPGIPSLYEVPLEGGLEQPVPADWGYWGSFSPDGKHLAYNRHPMAWARKHYRGSFAADLWILDLAAKSSHKLLDRDLADDMKPNNIWPMFGNGEIYFVSDRNIMAKAGSRDLLASRNNIWKISEQGGTPVQLTNHESGSLFWPSLSSDAKTIVYEESFGIWKLDLATGKTAEIVIDIASDARENNTETVELNSEASSFHLSPSGKRAVVAVRRELWTIATDRGEARPITRTPGTSESQPLWSPDGRWIAYISDESGREEIWLTNEQGIVRQRVTDSDMLKGQLAWSPNSRALAYAGSDGKLYRYDLEGNQSHAIAGGAVVSFGGFATISPQWSPDARWIAYTKLNPALLPHVFLVPAQGGQERRLTSDETHSDSNARWTADGRKIVYLVGEEYGNIGQSTRPTLELFVVGLQAETRDPLDRGIDSELPSGAGIDTTPSSGTTVSEQTGTGIVRSPGRPMTDVVRGGAIQIDFSGLHRRARALTRSADSISSLAISPDSQFCAFVTSGVEGGRSVQSIWTIQLDGSRSNRLVQSSRSTEEESGQVTPGQGGISSLHFARDGRTLYFLQGRGIYSVSVLGGAGTAEAALATGQSLTTGSRRGGIEAGIRRLLFSGRIEVDRRDERKQVLQESWQIMKHRFYDPQMHGVDWRAARGMYEPLLAHVADQEDLQHLITMMLGELNASHTGISGGITPEPGRTETRFPGFELEPDDSGYYRISHVYANGPADKDYLNLKAGAFVLAIDGKNIKVPENYWQHYARTPSTKMEFTVNNQPSRAGARRIKIVPANARTQENLQYEKWVSDRRDRVSRLTAGKIGYLHIRQMNEPSLRKFERDLAGLHLKDALIIDQRFNPGGRIDQELLQILQQRQYQYTRTRNSVIITRPLRGFFGPMAVLINERSTSDAEMFPDGFRASKLGKIIGVTTYGAVIGTGSHTLMDGSSLRTPGIGVWTIGGKNLENYGVAPDVYVENSPEDFLKGRDAQLEKAVEVLKEEIARRQ